MKRILLLTLTAGLIAGALAPTPAMATKAIPTTLYFHGRLPLGEAETPENIAGFTFMKMDPTKPTNPAPSSKSFGWGNTACAGNHFFPQWVAGVSGTLVGDFKVIFTTVSNEQDIDIRVFRVNTQLCNGDYPKPVIEKTVSLPAAPTEVTLIVPNVRIKALGALMVQFSPTMLNNLDTPGAGRILYDSSSEMSRIEFNCIPPKGASSCVL